MKCENGTQAAINVGYSEKAAAAIGSRLLTMAKVKRRINELTKPIIEELREEVVIDRGWVVNQAVRIVKSCGQMLTLRNKAGEALIGDDGQEIKQPINPKAVTQSLNLIADVLALKTETRLNVNLSAQEVLAEVLAEVERRRALTTTHVEAPMLSGEDSLYLPKNASEGADNG